jgi:hypothetical protein
MNQDPGRLDTAVIDTEFFDWRTHAACADMDPETFLPTSGGNAQKAKEVCAPCPVKAACLEHALENHPMNGVWGATSLKQRIAIRSARREEQLAKDAEARAKREQRVRKLLDERMPLATIAQRLGIGHRTIARLAEEYRAQKGAA